MSKYSDLACDAANRIRSGAPVVEAWDSAAFHTFPSQPASRAKGCPKCAFLGLAEEGLIRGVPKGKYTRSHSNKSYALKALSILQGSPELADDPNELWDQVMDGVRKKHNQQMNVVIGLWKGGDLRNTP